MKICPQCQTSYTDDTLQFCLQDGTPLGSQPVSDSWAESETLVSPPRNRADDSQVTRVSELQPEPKKSNTASVVLLTILGTLLFFGLAGTAAWFYLKDRKTEVAQNTNKPVPPLNASNVNRMANGSPSPAISPKISPQTSPTANVATPTPPVASNFDPKQVETNVKGEINNWKTTLQSGDLDAVMDSYADRLDYYYNSSGVSASSVRKDKERAFELFDDFQVKVQNIRVIPDETGEKATAVFEKEWKFKGPDDRRNEGKVQQQMQLTKIGGRWRITGERDLKVYYTR